MAIETQKFVRKPLYVDAVRVSTTNFDEISDWCQGEVEYESLVGEDRGDAKTNSKKYIKVRVHNPKNPRQTKAFVGDWLLYTERGYKVYTNKAFHASFDKVGDGQIESEETRDNTEFPLIYIDPETGFLTDEKPHDGATALSFEEVMDTVLKELHSERHYARLEARANDQPDPIIPLPITEVIEATPEVIAEAVQNNEELRLVAESPDQNEQMPSDPAGVVDTNVPVSPTAVPPVLVEPKNPPPGKYVLSKKEQREMSSDEIKDLVQGGQVILEQDLQA